MKNLRKTEKPVGKTGFKGVHKVKENVYQAQLTLRIAGIQRIKIIGGSYKTPEEAYVARVNYIKKLL